MAVAASTVYWPPRESAIATDQQAELTRARGVLGNPSNYLTYWWTPAEGAQAVNVLSLDASSSQSYPREGVLRLSSGATGGHAAVLRWRDSTGSVTPLFIPGATGDKAYMSARFAVSAGDASSQISIGAVGATEKILMGYDGAVSNTHFTVSTNDNDITSAVALDTSFHTHRVWVPGDDVTHYQIDNNAEATLAAAWLQGEDGAFYAVSNNGGTAASRTLDINWIFALVPRST